MLIVLAIIISTLPINLLSSYEKDVLNDEGSSEGIQKIFYEKNMIKKRALIQWMGWNIARGVVPLLFLLWPLGAFLPVMALVLFLFYRLSPAIGLWSSWRQDKKEPSGLLFWFGMMVVLMPFITAISLAITGLLSLNSRENDAFPFLTFVCSMVVLSGIKGGLIFLPTVFGAVFLLISSQKEVIHSYDQGSKKINDFLIYWKNIWHEGYHASQSPKTHESENFSETLHSHVVDTDLKKDIDDPEDISKLEKKNLLHDLENQSSLNSKNPSLIFNILENVSEKNDDHLILEDAYLSPKNFTSS
jgi:hypothetical protein